MAAYTLTCTRRSAQPIARQATAGVEETITVNAKAMPGNRATITMVATVAFTYSLSQGVVAAAGWPVAANEKFSVVLQDGDIFYINGAAGFIDYLVAAP